MTKNPLLKDTDRRRAGKPLPDPLKDVALNLALNTAGAMQRVAAAQRGIDTAVDALDETMAFGTQSDAPKVKTLATQAVKALVAVEAILDKLINEIKTTA